MPVYRVLITCILLAPSAWAAIDAYDFSSEQAHSRYQQLTAELRCPKCQNQNLADSNSLIAADMRQQVYRMIESGETNEQVIEFMVTRYGDFVRYRPKKDASTWLLWYGPLLVLAGGIVLGLTLVRGRRSDEVTPESVDNDKMKQLLAEYEDKDHR